MLYTLRFQEQVVVKKFAAADFNFKTPTTKLYNKVAGAGDGGRSLSIPGFVYEIR